MSSFKPVLRKLELVDVVVQHGEDLAQPVLLEEGDLARLDALVGVQPEVVLHPLRKVHEPRLVHPLEEALEEEDGDREPCQRRRQSPGVRGAGETGDPARLLAVERVDDPADEERRHHVEDLVGDARGDGIDEPAAVAPQVAEEPPHGVRRLGQAGRAGGCG